MGFSAKLVAEDQSFEAPLTEVVYRSPTTGALLEVQHDVDALAAARDGSSWRALLEARWGQARGLAASGVWAQHEWVHPQLQAEHVVTLGEGKSPLQPLPRLAKAHGLSSLELKQCGITATGSFKDLGMTVLVSHVKKLRAAGKNIRAVMCASTGDTSAALAAYCASAEIPCVVLLPKGKISLAQLLQPVSHGAHVFALDTDFDGCMKVVQTLSADPTLYLANSMNPLRLEGQKTVGIEIALQRGWELPDWIVIPGGNLGNVSALAKGLQLIARLGLVSRLPRIAVAQAAHANPLAQAFKAGTLDTLVAQTARSTQASAIQIGNPVSFSRAVRALKAMNGVVEEASEQELSDASALADREGTFCCPHTGVALAAALKLTAAGTIQRGQSVVVVSTAHGLKFTSFKEGYHRGELPLVKPSHPNPFLEVTADAAAVERALDQRLGRG